MEPRSAQPRHDYDPDVVARLHQRLYELEAKQARHAALSRRLVRGLTVAATLLAVFAGMPVVQGQGGADALFVSPDGNVGIGTTPMQKLDVAGIVRSSAGFQFPDGSTQTTAVVLPRGAIMAFNLATCPAGWTEFTAAYGRFIRGIDKSGRAIDADGQRGPGSTQEDAIRNITGSVSGVNGADSNAWPWGFRPGQSGAFQVTREFAPYNRYSGQYNPGDGVGTSASFDASRVVATAPENRPKNVALLYCQKEGQ